MAAAEISNTGDLPPHFTTLRLPGQRYAVFTHRGHVSGISSTMNRIFGAWWPTSGLEHADMPDMFERYDERFDPYTGVGVTEIWLPIRE